MKLKKVARTSLSLILMAVLFILTLQASAEERIFHQDLPGEKSSVLRGLVNQERYFQILSEEGRLMLIVFDFESLSCPLCLDSFKNFCEALQSSGMQNSALGVLTFRDPEGAETYERYTRIIEKKLRGFILGNTIEFPILLDKFHIFAGMNLKEPAIFLFDLSKGMVKKYKFPLTKKQLEGIFNGQKKD